jgi:hypothetical protein
MMAVTQHSNRYNPAPDRRFRICPCCPYFCRVEEEHRECPWCGVRLRALCACGLDIANPCDAECVRCGASLRESAREARPPAAGAFTVVPWIKRTNHRS